MLKRRIQVRSIQGVGAGKTALIDLPVGPRYHAVVLVTGDTAAAGTGAPTNSAIINECRVYLNSQIQRRFTAFRLDAINTGMETGGAFASQAYTGGAAGGGRRHLPIYFNEPWRKRIQDQDALAWQTGWLPPKSTFQIECDLQAGITPFLSAYAIIDQMGAPGSPSFTGQPKGIMKWYTHDFAVAGASYDMVGLPRRDSYSQLSLFDTSDGKSVTRVRAVAGPLEVHDLSNDENTSFLKSVDMNPASGRYDVVFDHDDSLDDLLPADGLSDLLLTTTFSAAAAGTLSVIAQRLGLPD